MKKRRGITYMRVSVGLLRLNIRSAYELLTLALVVGFGMDGLFLSHGRLARLLRIDRRSAVRVIQRLEAAGHVVVSRRDGRRFVRPSVDTLSLARGDSLSTANSDNLSRGVVTGKSLPSKQKVEALTLNSSAPARTASPPGAHPGHTRPQTIAFAAPTAEEVGEYAEAQGHPEFDAAYFVRYYTESAWLKANGKPVANWKLAVLAWLKRDADLNPAPTKRQPQRGDFDWLPTEAELAEIEAECAMEARR